MGNVKMQFGLGFSSDGQGQYIDMAAVLDRDTTPKELRQVVPDEKLITRPWSPWGPNNFKPLEMAADIDTCGPLNSIIDMMMRLGVCNGPQPVIMRIGDKGVPVVDKYINDPEIKDFLDNNNIRWNSRSWMVDKLGFGQGIARFGLNRKKDPKIVIVQRDDVVEFRYEKKSTRGFSENVFLSAEWEKVRSEEDKRVFSVPLLRFYNPAGDMLKRIQAGQRKEFAYTFRRPGWNKQYYSVPLWYPAYKWVKIAQAVPEMKAVMFENNMRVKYVVIIHETYWKNAFGDDWMKYTDAQKQEKQEQVWTMIDNLLVGSKNAYKSIFTTGFRDHDGKTWSEIEIKPVEDSTRQGELLPDSAAANSEIAFAMHFNPALFGGNQKAGLYQQESGGSSIRESGLMQVMLMEEEREDICNILKIVTKVNEWDKRHPGIDWIIPATALTTLDTGAGSKSILTGGAQPKDNGNNNND